MHVRKLAGLDSVAIILQSATYLNVDSPLDGRSNLLTMKALTPISRRRPVKQLTVNKYELLSLLASSMRARANVKPL
jgi:hypothetical protein